MSEHVKVWQNNQFETGFWAADPHEPESDELQPVEHIHELTPYGMLMASLGSCTTIVLNTYAQHHGLDLQEVEVELKYERVFLEDCENCEEIERYEEQFREELTLQGELSSAERDKLLRIAHQCSIAKILEDGAEIETQLAPALEKE